MNRDCNMCATCSPDCALRQLLNQPETEIGKAADKFYAFMSAEGLGRKLSLCDMRKIFKHFKENWRPL